MKTAMKYMAIAATLAVVPAAFAAEPMGTSPSGQTGTSTQTGAPGQTGETSDRTPGKATPTPQAQQDTSGGKTSDRTPDKNVKVEHQPGAAGTAGSNSDSNTSANSGSDKMNPGTGSGQSAE